MTPCDCRCGCDTQKEVQHTALAHLNTTYPEQMTSHVNLYNIQTKMEEPIVNPKIRSYSSNLVIYSKLGPSSCERLSDHEQQLGLPASYFHDNSFHSEEW